LKNILGIGACGTNVVKQLSEYPQYSAYYINNKEKKTTKYRFSLPLLESPEDYENMDMSKLHRWASKIKNNCTVFLTGANDSSAIALRFLEKLHQAGVKINIVYFLPEVEVLSENKFLHERSCRGILQQFARSGLFQNMTLVSNLSLESMAGPTNVYEYYSQINNVFTSSYYMIDVFKNSNPIASTFKGQKESCRIATIGLGSLQEEEGDKLFFPLENTVEIVYYYCINEEKLRTEENLFRQIANKVKSKITENVKASFGIFPTQYENDYVYTEYYTPKVQE